MLYAQAAAGEVVMEANILLTNVMPFEGYGGSKFEDEAYSWNVSCAPRFAYAVASLATESITPPYTKDR